MIFLHGLASNEAWISETKLLDFRIRDKTLMLVLSEFIRLSSVSESPEVVALILEEDNAIKQNSDLET